MVIQHHHIDALGRRNRPMRKRAAVDADNEIVIARQPRHRLIIGAIALVNAVRDIKRRLLSHLAQVNQKQCRRRAAIYVVIGKDCNPLASFYRLEKPGGGLFHVLQAARIGEEVF